MSSCLPPPKRNATLAIILQALFELKTFSTVDEVYDQLVSTGAIGALTIVDIENGLILGGRRGLWRTDCRALDAPAPQGPYSELIYVFDRSAIARNPGQNTAYADPAVIRTPGNSAYPIRATPLSCSCPTAKGSPNGSGYPCCDIPNPPI